MRPIITCEKPAFRQLIMGLTGISDISFLPDSKVISKELKLRYMSYVTMLTKYIFQSNHLFVQQLIYGHAIIKTI